MNKLYLLAALAACAYAAQTEDDADSCSVEWEELEDEDYAYGFTVTVEPDTETQLGDTDADLGTVCMHDYVFSFEIDTVEPVNADGDDATDDVDDDAFIYALDYSDEDTPEDTLTMAEVWSIWTEAEEGDGTELGAGDSFASAVDDDESEVYGATIYVLWAGAADDLVITGFSNNAVISAASAFTAAAVAGLFF